MVLGIFRNNRNIFKLIFNSPEQDNKRLEGNKMNCIYCNVKPGMEHEQGCEMLNSQRTDIICTVCGHPIKGSGDQKTGRPKQYHNECRQLNNAFSLLQNRLEAFRELNPKADKKKIIRSLLWSLANSMNGKDI